MNPINTSIIKGLMAAGSTLYSFTPSLNLTPSILSGLVAAGSTLYTFPPFSLSPPLQNPDTQLTGSMIQSKLSLENFSDHLLIYNIQSMLLEKNPLLAFDKEKSDLFCFHRNFISKVLILDDGLRLENRSLQNSLNEEQKNGLLKTLTEIESIIKQQNEIKSPQLFGELVKVVAALKQRLGLSENELSPQEAIDLFSILYKLRKDEILNLMLPSKKQLLTLSKGELQALKKADLPTRFKYLELVAPIDMGLSNQELYKFIEELLEPAKKQIIPLIKHRKKLIAEDKTWEALIEKKIEEQATLEKALKSAFATAQEDVELLKTTPCFGRTLLKYGQFFSEDFFDTCYIMKLVSLKSYFESPHAMTMLSEYHLNKQIFAANDCLQTVSEDSPVLMISSSLDEKKPLIPVSDIPFPQVHVSDDIQRAVEKENLRRINDSVESSCLPEQAKVFYLPGKGICFHDPNLIPENMNELAPFDSIEKENSCTPAISFGNPNSCLNGTHAFTELYLEKKRYIPGKYVRFTYEYDKLSTYSKIASSIVPRILYPNQASIFSPDPAVAYENHTRHIAKLKSPLPMNEEQKQAFYNILRKTYLGDKDHPFTAHNYNCTTLTENLLKIAGIDLPCRAPFSSLLRINYPTYTSLITKLSNRPIVNLMLQAISSLAGAQDQKVTLEKLNYVISPYVARLWVSLKNSIEEIESVK